MVDFNRQEDALGFVIETSVLDLVRLVEEIARLCHAPGKECCSCWGSRVERFGPLDSRPKNELIPLYLG